MTEILRPTGQGRNVAVIDRPTDNRFGSPEAGLFQRVGPVAVLNQDHEGQHENDPANRHPEPGPQPQPAPAAPRQEEQHPLPQQPAPERHDQARPAPAGRGQGHGEADHRNQAHNNGGHAGGGEGAGHETAPDTLAPYRNITLTPDFQEKMRRSYAENTSRGMVGPDHAGAIIPAGVAGTALTYGSNLDLAGKAGGYSALITLGYNAARIGIRSLLGRPNPASAEATSILQKGGVGERIRSIFDVVTRWKVKRRIAKMGRLEEAAKIAAEDGFAGKTEPFLKKLYAKVRYARQFGQEMDGFRRVGRTFDAKTQIIKDRLTSLGNISQLIKDRLEHGKSDLERLYLEEKTQSRMRWENIKMNAGILYDRFIGAFPVAAAIVAAPMLLVKAKEAATAGWGKVTGWWNSDLANLQRHLTHFQIVDDVGIPNGKFWDSATWAPVKTLGTWLNTHIITPVSAELEALVT